MSMEGEATYIKCLFYVFPEVGKLSARGYGRGRGGRRQGVGGPNECVCPKCGETTKHVRGKPCNKVKCPKCGTPMQGSAETQD